MRGMLTLSLTFQSLRNRRLTAALTISAIAISVALLLGVQMLRTAARDSFASTVSGVDLIVGARSGPLNLLLYSVFHIGDATANVSWESYQKVARHRDVAWTIPISLGDSHRGFRVMGTNADYFRHYRFGESRALAFSAGQPFRDLYDAVIGADVARTLGYKVGDEIVVGHGLGEVSFARHEDKPFRVVGVLRKTGTPVDRTVHVSLEAVTAIHLDWQSGMQAPPRFRVSAKGARESDLKPASITAFMVGMKSRSTAFVMQRAINVYGAEPLTAVLPGVALSELWNIVGIADNALALVAAFVVLAGLLCMLTAILTSLNERRREMAVLRSVGASPRHVFSLMVLEAGVLAALGIASGTAITYATLLALRSQLESHVGVYVQLAPPEARELAILASILLAALIMALLPAFRAYRNSLSDGLQIRV